MACVWEPDLSCLGPEWGALDEDMQERALMLATSSLQMLTYNRVGACPITIRPTPVVVGSSCETPPLRLREYALPGPVGYISSLIVDGVLLDPWSADWRMDDGHILVWQGEGISPLPASQDLTKPLTEEGTWGITYSRSHPVGQDGKIAVAALAMEFANACKPKGKCALPRGVVNVVRNGVSFSVEAGLFPGGLTGLNVPDEFILKWAPAGAPRQAARVFDPAVLKDHRTTNSVLRPPV